MTAEVVGVTNGSVTTIQDCRQSYHLVYLHFYHLHGGLYICLFHCYVLLYLFNNNLFTIHDVQALARLSHLTSLHVVVLT